MKKTLFAMAALALCGTAVAEDVTIQTKDYNGDYYFAPYGASLTVVVNETVEFANFSTTIADSVTLNFVGANTFSSAEELYMPYLVSVMGDDAAKASWGETFLSSTGAGDYKTITLATSVCSDTWFPEAGENDPTFAGASAGGSVTLGNAEVTYMGYFDGISPAQHAIENYGEAYSNAVALISDTSGLYLYGLATTKPTPEPATATLSLMALAGLCARRRRH